MKNYRVDVGNSTDGPIGFVVYVAARSRKAALRIVREGLPIEGVRVPCLEGATVVVYFNPERVGIEDVAVE